MTKRTMLTAVPAALILGSAGLIVGLAPTVVPATPETVASAAADEYMVDSVHSTVLFQTRHVGITKFYGRFNDYSGTFSFDSSTDTLSDVTFVVQTASVDTGNKSRDEHLRNADFFNARQFATIEFASTEIKHQEGAMYALTGDLTMQGETNTITAELEWLGTGTGPSGKPIAAYEARFEIKRGDFGMTKYLAPDGSDSGGVGNVVKLIVSVEAIKQ